MKDRSHYQSLENEHLVRLTREYNPSEDFALLASVLADRLEEVEEELNKVPL